MISESLIYEGGHTKLVLCDNLEGQGAEGGGWEGGPRVVLLEPGASAGLDCFPVCPLMQNSCNSFI